MNARTIAARIRFLTHAEGGRSSTAMSGIRPQLKLGTISTSCIVRSRGTTEHFEPGIEHEVDLELVLWDEYGHLIPNNAEIELFEGSRLIARGQWQQH